MKLFKYVLLKLYNVEKKFLRIFHWEKFPQARIRNVFYVETELVYERQWMSESESRLLYSQAFQS